MSLDLSSLKGGGTIEGIDLSKLRTGGSGWSPEDMISAITKVTTTSQRDMISMVSGGWNDESKQKAISMVNERLDIKDSNNTHVIAVTSSDTTGLSEGDGEGNTPPKPPPPQRIILGGNQAQPASTDLTQQPFATSGTSSTTTGVAEASSTPRQLPRHPGDLNSPFLSSGGPGLSSSSPSSQHTHHHSNPNTHSIPITSPISSGGPSRSLATSVPIPELKPQPTISSPNPATNFSMDPTVHYHHQHPPLHHQEQEGERAPMSAPSGPKHTQSTSDVGVVSLSPSRLRPLPGASDKPKHFSSNFPPNLRGSHSTRRGSNSTTTPPAQHTGTHLTSQTPPPLTATTTSHPTASHNTPRSNFGFDGPQIGHALNGNNAINKHGQYPHHNSNDYYDTSHSFNSPLAAPPRTSTSSPLAFFGNSEPKPSLDYFQTNRTTSPLLQNKWDEIVGNSFLSEYRNTLHRQAPTTVNVEESPNPYEGHVHSYLDRTHDLGLAPLSHTRVGGEYGSGWPCFQAESSRHGYTASPQPFPPRVSLADVFNSPRMESNSNILGGGYNGGGGGSGGSLFDTGSSGYTPSSTYGTNGSALRDISFRSPEGPKSHSHNHHSINSAAPAGSSSGSNSSSSGPYMPSLTSILGSPTQQEKTLPSSYAQLGRKSSLSSMAAKTHRSGSIGTSSGGGGGPGGGGGIEYDSYPYMTSILGSENINLSSPLSSLGGREPSLGHPGSQHHLSGHTHGGATSPVNYPIYSASNLPTATTIGLSSQREDDLGLRPTSPLRWNSPLH